MLCFYGHLIEAVELKERDPTPAIPAETEQHLVGHVQYKELTVALVADM